MPASTRGGVHPRTFQSYIRLKLPDKTIFNMPCDVPTVSARNTSLAIAAEAGAKALLFIDSDMEFLGDSYRRLSAVKADIVCGLFHTRSAPSTPTIMVKHAEEEGKFSLRSIVPDGKVHEIDACGMAFTLIREPVIKWAAKESAEKGIPAFRHVVFGEDLDFVMRARNAGFKAKCDTSIQIAHRGDVGFNGQPELVNPLSGHLNHPFGNAFS